MPAAGKALLLAALAVLQPLQAVLAAAPQSSLDPTILFDDGRVAVFLLNLTTDGGGLRIASHPTSPLIAVQAGRDVVVISPWWVERLPSGPPGRVYAAVWGPYLAVYDARTGGITLYLATPEGLEVASEGRLFVGPSVSEASFALVGSLACLAAPGVVAYAPLDSPGSPEVVEWPGTPRMASCSPLDELGWGEASPWEPVAAVFRYTVGGLALLLEGPGVSTVAEVYEQAGADAVTAAAFPGPGSLAAALIPRPASSAAVVLVTLANYSFYYQEESPVAVVESARTFELWSKTLSGRAVAADLALALGPRGSVAVAAAAAYLAGPGLVNVSLVAARVGPDGSVSHNESYVWAYSARWSGPVEPPVPVIPAPGRVGLAVMDAGGPYVLAWAGFALDPRSSSSVEVVLAAPGRGVVELPSPLQGGPVPDYQAAGSGYGIAALALTFSDQGFTLVYYMVDRAAAPEAGQGGPGYPALIPVASLAAESRLLALYHAPSLGAYVLFNVSEGFPAIETPWGLMPLPLLPPLPGKVYRLTVYAADGVVETPLPQGCGVEVAGSVTSPTPVPIPGSTTLQPLDALEASGRASFRITGPTASIYAVLDCGDSKALAVVRARPAEPYRAHGYLAAIPGGAALVVVGLEGSPPLGAAVTVTGPWGHEILPLPPAGQAVVELLPPCGQCYISISAYGYVAAAAPPASLTIELPGGVNATRDPDAAAEAGGEGVVIVAGRYPIPIPGPSTPAVQENPSPPSTTTAPQAPVNPWTAARLAASAAAGAILAGLACAPRRHGKKTVKHK